MKQLYKIIIAEDDVDDRALIKKVIEQIGINVQLKFVVDGEDLMQHLHDQQDDENPSIIFLDLNMPRKDGRQALKEIKRDEKLKKIPVIIFTTSNNTEDVQRTYESGANCFITKPTTYMGLVKTIKNITDFWFETTILPAAEN